MPESATAAFRAPVLHGSWLPPEEAQPGGFAAWAELAPDAPVPPRHRRKAAASGEPPHPFAATADRLRHALIAGGLLNGEGPVEIIEWVARLPSAAGSPLPSPELGIPAGDRQVAEPSITAWRVAALRLGAAEAPTFLLAQAASRDLPGAVPGADLRYWLAATRFLLELLHRQRFRPILETAGPAHLARWRLLLDETADRTRFEALARAMPPVCRALARDAASILPHAADLLQGFLDATADAIARAALQPLDWPGAAAGRRGRRPTSGEPARA